MIQKLVDRMKLPNVSQGEVEWQQYEHLRKIIAGSFVVPGTNCSPLMSKLLFALGQKKNPGMFVGVGSFFGYCVSWLMGLASSRQMSIGLLVDPDPVANFHAGRNLANLGYVDSIDVVTARGEELLKHRNFATQIDLLYLDLDDPVHGKRGYADVLNTLFPVLALDAIVIAHDPCVPRFSADFSRYHETIRAHPKLMGPWVIPIDDCGISIAVKQI